MGLLVKPLVSCMLTEHRMCLSQFCLHEDVEQRENELLERTRDLALLMRPLYVRFRGLGVLRQGEVLFVGQRLLM